MIHSENIDDVIAEIESFKTQIYQRSSISKGVELIPNEKLFSELSGHYGTYFVRFILFHLGIDENQVLKWRLENKYLQYQIFNHYSPGCIPNTYGLSNILKQDQGVQKVRKLFSSGYFLKATLGDASFASRSWDKTKNFDDLIIPETSSDESYESYMIQKKLKLLREFRVHTFCKEIIPFFTYRIPNTTYFNYHREAEIFVSTILLTLPDQILQGTIIGWDIGLTNSGEYYVIEANFTGFHSEYRRGFQTTGYVDNPQYGAIICAWLNKFFEINYGIYIFSIHPSLVENNPFYKAFIFYSGIFDNRLSDLVMDKRYVLPISVIIYLGGISNTPILNLLNHFLSVDLVEKYYIIVNHACYSIAISRFKQLHVKIIDETVLFTAQQYEAIIHMGFDRRKQISCYHLARTLNNETYLII